MTKIALLGSAPSSKMLAPFNDPEWEIWACSPANCDLPRCDAFFEIHGLDTTLLDPQYAEFVKWCKTHPRVYMQEKRSEFPGAVKYPFDEMRKRFGDYFWTSSLAYMLALAISEQPEIIGHHLQRCSLHSTIPNGKSGRVHLRIVTSRDVTPSLKSTALTPLCSIRSTRSL